MTKNGQNCHLKYFSAFPMKSYYRITKSQDGEEGGREFNEMAAGALEEQRWKRYRFDVRKSTLKTTWIYRQNSEEKTTAKQEFKMDDLQDFLNEYVRDKMDGAAHPGLSGIVRNAYLRH